MRDKELTHAVEEWEHTRTLLARTTQRLVSARAKILELDQQRVALEADVAFAVTRMPLSLKEEQEMLLSLEEEQTIPLFLKKDNEMPPSPTEEHTALDAQDDHTLDGKLDDEIDETKGPAPQGRESREATPLVPCSLLHADARGGVRDQSGQSAGKEEEVEAEVDVSPVSGDGSEQDDGMHVEEREGVHALAEEGEGAVALQHEACHVARVSGRKRKVQAVEGVECAEEERDGGSSDTSLIEHSDTSANDSKDRSDANLPTSPSTPATRPRRDAAVHHAR